MLRIEGILLHPTESWGDGDGTGTGRGLTIPESLLIRNSAPKTQFKAMVEKIEDYMFCQYREPQWAYSLTTTNAGTFG